MMMKIAIHSLPIGEQDLEFEKVVRDGDRLIVTARAGFMDTTLIVTSEDIPKLVKVLLSKASLGLALRWPYYRLKRKKSIQAEE